MNSGYYATYAGLQARMQALEVLANNLANTSTTGYKVEREFYRSLVANLGRSALQPLNRAINNFGVLGGAAIDFRPGTMARAGNDLDLALEGAGLFVVQTARGVRYTRNGNFSLDTKRKLTTSSGDFVLGEQGPIEVPLGPVSVAPDGTLSVRGAVVARLRVVEMAPGVVVEREGSSYFAAPQASERPARDPGIRQGTLESANINPVVGTVSVIELQRQVELLQRALSIIHTEFNRTAVEDVPRL